METIDLTPVGVQKDPARVNAALGMFETCNANARDALRDLLEFIEVRENGCVVINGRLLSDAHFAQEVKDAKDALSRCDDSQEEMLRAIAGAPRATASRDGV